MSAPLSQRYDLKKIIIVGGFAVSVLNALTGGFIYLFMHNESFHLAGLALTTITIWLLLFTFGAAVGSASFKYVSYMMPKSAMLGAQVLNFLLSGGSIIAFSYDLSLSHSPVIVIWIFAGVSFVLSIINSIFLVEVKKKKISDVQKGLANKL